jgi:hypothetical protein
VECPIEVVPDSALLVDRVLPPAALAGRLDRLRAAGCYPAGPALVLQGCDLIVPLAGRLARAVGAWLDRQPVPPGAAGSRPAGGALGVQPVIVETGRCRGDTLFADAIGPALAPRRALRLPPGAGIEDLAAAIAGGALFVGSSLHGAITALVHGRPFVLLNLAGESKLDGFGDLTGLEDRVVHDIDALGSALDRAVTTPAPPGLLADLQRRIDAHFDRIAELALAAASARQRTSSRRSLRRVGLQRRTHRRRR